MNAEQLEARLARLEQHVDVVKQSAALTLEIVGKVVVQIELRDVTPELFESVREVTEAIDRLNREPML
jgi:hypothetical protein